jgi:hypothetical protein
VTRNLEQLYGWGKAAALAAVLAAILVPQASLADVARIREMALEMELKLNRHHFDVDARGEKPNSARIYKDYDFILKKNKVDEVSTAVGSDPHAQRLRFYLIEAIVNSEIAAFEDELRDFEQNGSAELDGAEVPYSDLLKRLAVTSDAGERRQVASLLPPLIETSGVFRKEISKRRNKLYQGWGFQDYADFYAQREGLDLLAVAESAEALLAESQALYDSLFKIVAESYLEMEPRKVRFTALPHLVQGTAFEGAFPSGERIRRLKGLFRGLGLNIDEQPDLDRLERPGKVLRAFAVPVLLPDDVKVSVNPTGAGVRDGNKVVYAIGEALVYSMSEHDGLEDGYLVNEPAQSAMAWLPRFVLDEPGWIQANVKADGFSIEEYLVFRAFLSLYEARFMAGMIKFELVNYRGVEDPFKEFNAIMRQATGARLSTNDAARALEFLSQLSVASRFHGLLVASGVRAHFRESLGQDWYAEGKAGAALSGLFKQGGKLTIKGIAAVCPYNASTDAFIDNIEAMLSRASKGE